MFGDEDLGDLFFFLTKHIFPTKLITQDRGAISSTSPIDSKNGFLLRRSYPVIVCLFFASRLQLLVG